MLGLGCFCVLCFILGFSVKVKLTVHYYVYVQGGPENVALYYCSYFCQLLTDFQNFFTVTLCRQFAITCLLHISPHRKCVSTLACEISLTLSLIHI